MNNQNINPKTLKGKDVFNRTLDLMDKLTPINESVINASLEFIKRGPNGLVYTIIRENRKYFIKSSDKTEFKISELDYTGGLQNKMNESYSTYEEALKHLNMKFHELNELYNVKDGYNLFEQDIFEAEDVSNEETGVKEKKYKLKLSSEETPSEEIPTPSPEEPMGPGGEIETPSIEDVSAGSEEMGAEEMGAEEMTSPETEEPAGTEEPMETEEDEEDIDIDEEEDPKKYIQKLTGRLGQKLRELSEVDPKLEKYVINSIISALHIDKMDKKDRIDVIKKFKKKKGMESIMKESYEMDEYYGMMSLDGPFNYQKIKGGFDERKEKTLRFKKHELGMDEELHGDQHKLDLNKNGRLDKEDFKMLRSKKHKESSDEQWQGLAARAAGAALGSYLSNKMDSDENLDRKSRIKDALDRIRMKRKKSMEDDEIKFHSSKDEKFHHDMDEVDVSDLSKIEYGMGNHDEPEISEPYKTEPDVMEPDVDKPLTPPTPRRQNPFNPPIPDKYPQPKAKTKK